VFDQMRWAVDQFYQYRSIWPIAQHLVNGTAHLVNSAARWSITNRAAFGQSHSTLGQTRIMIGQALRDLSNALHVW